MTPKHTSGRGYDLYGETFGRLTVIGTRQLIAYGSGARSAYSWMCRCTCGVEKFVQGQLLKRGIVQSCGCLRTERTIASKRLPRGENGFNKLLHNYKRGAVARDLSFSLSRDEFRALTQGDCHYCGVGPSQLSRQSARSGTTAAGIEHGSYLYNGVDRVDNELGYSPENSVPCCATCNRSKGSLTYAFFMAWLANASRYQALKDDTV